MIRTIFRKLPALSVLIFILILLYDQPVYSQKATITGWVKDAKNNEPLPGANVAVFSKLVFTGAATDEDGKFVVTGLEPSVYTLKVTYIGYRAVIHDQVSLRAGETKTLEIYLKPTSIQLNPISISASRRPEKILEAPASISVLEPRELERDVTTSSVEALRNVTGIDMASTGIDRREVVLRGFSNAFSGATYILTDYRRAAVPSLNVNLHSIMPNMAIDLARVEVVRGPSSALYGAGVDAGVIHYLTKDPFNYPGTTISFAGGERSSLFTNFRHAGLLSDNFGYKVTGQVATFNDWKFSPTDSLDAIQLNDDFVNSDPTTILDERIYDNNKFNLNGLLQYKMADDIFLTANGGYSAMDATLLSGVGTLRADNFGYSYGQLRFQAPRFFAQAYLNRNNVGDSFLYSLEKNDSTNALVDKSTFFSLQAQYDLRFSNDKGYVIFGLDYDRTTPVSDSTIYGRFEDKDLISEFGVYAQSLTKIGNKVDLTLALRGDYNNVESDFQFSPRVAFVYKPSTKHSLRATYNRAYALPNVTSLFLDKLASEDELLPGFSIFGRGLGGIDGVTFDAARTEQGLIASGLLPDWLDQPFYGKELIYPNATDPVRNIPLANVYAIVHHRIASLPREEIIELIGSPDIGIPDSVLAIIIDNLIDQLSPQNTVISDTAFGTSKLSGLPIDSKPLKATITNSFEVGYKGLIGDRFLFAVDAYYTLKKNFVSGNTRFAPIGEFVNIGSELQAALANAIDNNLALKQGLGLLNISPDSAASLITQAAVGAGLGDTPVAVVQPDQNRFIGEIPGGFKNFGDVAFWGIDVSTSYLANDNLRLFANVSMVSDDFFDSDELNEPGTDLQVALNSPKFKWKAGFSYAVPKSISFNSAVRFTKGFPVLSGPYAGFVQDYFLWDAGIGYDLTRLIPGLRLDLTVQNVLDNQHREFIGAPRLGRFAMARIVWHRD